MLWKDYDIESLLNTVSTTIALSGIEQPDCPFIVPIVPDVLYPVMKTMLASLPELYIVR